MSSIIAIVVLLWFFSGCSVSKLVEKSVGPVASCGGELVPAGSVIKSCYHRCLMDPEPVDRTNLELYRVSKNIDGPTVVECAKVRQRQTFTLTWSFSYIKSPVTHEFLRVTKEECDKAITDNCPNRQCNHREADDLEEEYHYASDTVKEVVTISLMSMPSSVQLVGETINISPLSAKTYSPLSDGMSKEDGKIYIWDSKYEIEGCPYEPVTTYGCDMYQDSDKRRYYMCSGGRFVVTAASVDEADLSSRCKGIRRSVEGFLYKHTEKEASSSDHSRLAISQTSEMKADVDYLRHKVQQIATHLDSEICQTQCEILAVESRLSRKDGSLVRIGMNYFKLFDNGTISGCLTLHGCRLTQPHIYCGNPPRMGVTCTENNGLWDPTTIELKRGGICSKPDRSEKLTISLGSEHYIVDDSMKISINTSSRHGIYMTSFSDLHQSSMQWKITEIDDLKPEWVGQKEGKGGLSKSIEKSTVLNTPSFTIGSNVMKAYKCVSDYVMSVEHAVGLIVIFIMSIAGILFALKMRLLFSGGNRAASSGKAYNAVPNNRKREPLGSSEIWM